MGSVEDRAAGLAGHAGRIERWLARDVTVVMAELPHTLAEDGRGPGPGLLGLGRAPQRTIIIVYSGRILFPLRDA